jgi:hypothetical protein
MAQALSRRPLTAEARVRSRVGPCGIYGWQSVPDTGFSPSTSVLSCKFHSIRVPLLGKIKKTLITWLHNTPQGCGASVASAAVPFSTKKKKNPEIYHYTNLLDPTRLMAWYLKGQHYLRFNIIPSYTNSVNLEHVCRNFVNGICRSTFVGVWLSD